MITIKIPKFFEYNQPRKDLKSMNWFRVQTNIGTSQSLLELPAEGRWLWVFLLSECAKSFSDTITLRLRYGSLITGISEQNITKYIKTMENVELLQILPVDVTCTLQPVTKTSPTRKEGRKEGEEALPYTKEFEEFWKEYPKRENDNKSKAFESWTKHKDRPSNEKLLPIVLAYKQTDTVKRGFQQMASTWLNQKGWTMELGKTKEKDPLLEEIKRRQESGIPKL